MALIERRYNSDSEIKTLPQASDACVRRRLFLSCADADAVGENYGRRLRAPAAADGPATLAGTGSLQRLPQGRIPPAQDAASRRRRRTRNLPGPRRRAGRAAAL